MNQTRYLLDEREVRAVLRSFQRRIDAIESIGGVSFQAATNGARVPDGWVRDTEAAYYVPPTFIFSESVH